MAAERTAWKEKSWRESADGLPLTGAAREILFWIAWAPPNDFKW